MKYFHEIIFNLHAVAWWIVFQAILEGAQLRIVGAEIQLLLYSLSYMP